MLKYRQLGSPSSIMSTPICCMLCRSLLYVERLGVTIAICAVQDAAITGGQRRESIILLLARSNRPKTGFQADKCCSRCLDLKHLIKATGSPAFPTTSRSRHRAGAAPSCMLIVIGETALAADLIISRLIFKHFECNLAEQDSSRNRGWSMQSRGILNVLATSVPGNGQNQLRPVHLGVRGCSICNLIRSLKSQNHVIHGSCAGSRAIHAFLDSVERGRALSQLLTVCSGFRTPAKPVCVPVVSEHQQGNEKDELHGQTDRLLLAGPSNASPSSLAGAPRVVVRATLDKNM